MDLEAIMAKFQGRVWKGVRQEILILTEIPHIKAHRARLLYKAGLRTVEAVAAVKSVDQLVTILTQGEKNTSLLSCVLFKSKFEN